MSRVTLYTRVACHLCEDARAALDAVRAEVPFDLDVVDVDTDPELVKAYGWEVPVVLVDGRKAFKYRVDPSELRAKLARSAS